MGPLANKVWIQPRSLAGSAPRPCGHEDLNRILQPQVVGALARRREQIECTQLQLSGSARTAGSVVVFATSADPIGFRSSTRDVEAQSAAKEHTSEERGDDRGLGVRRPGAGAGSSAVVGSTPTDPVEFRKCARDLKMLSAARKYTTEERGVCCASFSASCACARRPICCQKSNIHACAACVQTRTRTRRQRKEEKQREHKIGTDKGTHHSWRKFREIGWI